MEDNMMMNGIEETVEAINDIVPVEAKPAIFGDWKAVGVGAVGTLVLVGLVKLGMNAYSKKKAKKAEANEIEDADLDGIEAEFEEIDVDDDK